MSPYLAEFVGTTILLLFGNGVVANVVLQKTKGHGGGWIVITAAWAFAVTLAVFAVGRISGAHLNPAVTLALASADAFSWSLVPGYILAQVAGGITGATLVWLGYLAHWAETPDKDAKLACFCTAPAIRKTVPAIITEFIGTAFLLFAIMAIGKIGGDAEAHKALSSWFAPPLVGVTVFAIGLSLGGPTGYANNPARDLGPRIAHALLPVAGKRDSDWGYAWVPVFAPIAGGVFGVWIFRVLGF